MKFADIENYDDILKLTTDQIQQSLQNWVLHLKEKKIKGKSIKAKLCAVELFLDMNRIVFHKRILHKLIPSNDYIPGGEIPFTNEDIQKMLAVTPKLRSKALILFLASTGGRPASIADPILRCKHVENMSNDCKAVKIYDGSKEGYYAFLTPEASKSLDDYLKWRKFNGEELTDDSPIFANFENSKGKKNTL